MQDKNKQVYKIAQNFDEDFKLCDLEIKPQIKQAQKNNATKKFKDSYFAFYDDIKSPSLKKQDW